ncbi:MAG: hypothetical protein INQ03_17140 [Candidatus Heimdallarchaeota archaeon]|nr:hypothetical protein [Candidatus Heimdallarchaeota archaeon]
MSSQNIPMAKPGPAKMVVNILLLNPLIYALLLFLLSSITPEIVFQAPQDNFSDFESLAISSILFYVMLLLIPMEFIIAEFVVSPQIEKVEIPYRFGTILIGFVLFLAISVYGLLIGLISIFAETEPFLSWVRVGLYFVISIMLMLYHKGKHFDPWVRELEEHYQMNPNQDMY